MTHDKANGPDPFDPASLRLSGDLGPNLNIRKALIALPVRKPDKAWWVRAHPDEAYRLKTGVIELKGERGSEIYLVDSRLRPELEVEVTYRPKLLVTAVERHGTVFLWQVNLPRPDGRADEWSRTALEAVRLATTGWVRVTANMRAGCYDVIEATGPVPDPVWPEQPLQNLLRIAFKDRFIADRDDPLLRGLRGEA